MCSQQEKSKGLAQAEHDLSWHGKPPGESGGDELAPALVVERFGASGCSTGAGADGDDPLKASGSPASVHDGAAGQSLGRSKTSSRKTGTYGPWYEAPGRVRSTVEVVRPESDRLDRPWD